MGISKNSARPFIFLPATRRTSTNWSLSWKDRRVTSFDRQIVEHGDCVAYSVAGATVHAPRLKARAVAAAKLLREGVVSADTKPPATLRRKPRNMSTRLSKLVTRISTNCSLSSFSRCPKYWCAEIENSSLGIRLPRRPVSAYRREAGSKRAQRDAETGPSYLQKKSRQKNCRDFFCM